MSERLFFFLVQSSPAELSISSVCPSHARLRWAVPSLGPPVSRALAHLDLRVLLLFGLQALRMGVFVSVYFVLQNGGNYSARRTC